MNLSDSFVSFSNTIRLFQTVFLFIQYVPHLQIRPGGGGGGGEEEEEEEDLT